MFSDEVTTKMVELAIASLKFKGSQNWNGSGSRQALASGLLRSLVRQYDGLVRAFTHTGTPVTEASEIVRGSSARFHESLNLLILATNNEHMPSYISDGVIRALASYCGNEMQKHAENENRSRRYMIAKLTSEHHVFMNRVKDREPWKFERAFLPSAM